jgi:hypothetical protein
MKPTTFSRVIVITLALALSETVLAGAAVPATTVFVSNADDAGPGSFRDAIDRANADPAIAHVQFRGGVGVVGLQASVVFTGTQNLTISGRGAVIDGAKAGGPAFRTSGGGGDLSVFSLTVRNAPAAGIAIDVPPSSTGTVHVGLYDADIIENRGHGVVVNDQDDPATPGAEGESAASVEVTVVNSRFIGNGFSVTDRDGLRVNEGGAGDLTITVLFSHAEDNAADGIEADERGSGDVNVEMFGSTVTANGEFDPDDLDDGFDIDENDDGSIVGLVAFSAANDNFEEGFDFNENHAGDLRVDMLYVEANGNGEEGIDYEEDDDFAGGGDLVTEFFLVSASENGAGGGDAGMKIREKGDGDLDVSLTSVEASDNFIGGIQIREDANGDLLASIAAAATLANDGHGIDFDENREGAQDVSGDLTASVSRSISSDNTGAGVRADQQTPPGAGTLLLTRGTRQGNGAGPIAGNNVVVTVR